MCGRLRSFSSVCIWLAAEVFLQTHVSANGKRKTLMTKQSQIILTIIAIISFVIAFTLDITSFGQDRNISWDNIEIVKILAIVSMVLLGGLLLGLFLFRKQNYTSRIALTMPIAFILFS